MKTLNLDALAKTSRTLTLGGATYDVKEMTVENFIETTKAADALEKKKDKNIIDQIEASVSMIQRSVPDCPAVLLRELTIEQLSMVSKFLRGDLDETLSGEDATAEEGGEKK